MNSNMTLEFKSIVLHEQDNPSDFFHYCLEHQLYKKSNPDTLFHSRMKNVYEGKKIWQGLSATIALDNNIPIGICLMEHRKKSEERHIQRAGRTKNNSHVKNPWLKQYDWHFIHVGFISFYVKEEFRKKGIAIELLNAMEKIQYDLISKEQLPSEVLSSMRQNCLVVTAKDLAAKIVKKSKLFHPIACDINDGNYNENLSSICYSAVFDENFTKTWGNFKTLKKKVRI